MAVQIFWFPVIVIVSIVFAILVYLKTKSWIKVGFLFEIILPIVVFIISLLYLDKLIVTVLGLLELGLLINGIIGLVTK